MTKREPSHFLEPGERLKSKNGESIVVIQGVTLAGYRGTSYKRGTFNQIEETSVSIGLNWSASYVKAPRNSGGKPLPVEEQVPPRPRPGRTERVLEGFYEAQRLVVEGCGVMEATRRAGISKDTFLRYESNFELEDKHRAVDKEFRQCP